MRDLAGISDVNKRVRAEVLLLVDFLKRASMVLEKGAGCVYSVPAGNAAGRIRHVNRQLLRRKIGT